MHRIAAGFDGIYETHLAVADLGRSVAFYKDRLGLALAAEFPERGIAFFWVGSPQAGMLGLWQGVRGPLRTVSHFGFRAPRARVLSAVSDLRAAGIDPLGFNGEPVDEPVVLGWMPALSVYFKDPDGHSLEILHRLDDPADPAFGVGSWSAWQRRS